MNWASFSASAPELAAVFERAMSETGICLLGTIRGDGWPRISPNEVYLVQGELMLGMMWQSMKARDLARDSRITVATPQCDKDAKGGDLKLYGRVIEVSDAALRKAHADIQEAAINWRPTEPYHLFRLEIESAGFISFGEDRKLLRWTANGGVESLKHPEDS
jgi:hypothetical protein